MYKERSQEQIVTEYNKLEKLAQELGLRTKLYNGFCVYRDSELIDCVHTVDALESYLAGYQAAKEYAASLA
jgi:hypothetical protein